MAEGSADRNPEKRRENQNSRSPEPRLRLCYVADLRSAHTVRWVSYFAKKGHSILVLSPTAVEIPGVRIKKILRTPTLPKLVQLMNVLPIALGAGLFRPNVLHAHYARIYGWLAALTFFRPLVVTVWGGDILEDQGAFDDVLGRWLTPFALRRADVVTAHSRFLRDRVIALGKTPGSVRLVGCPGVDRHLFRPGLNTDELRRELGLGGRRVIYCPRIMDTLYNTDVILRAIPTVLKQVPDASFVFSEHMGSEPYVRRMKLLVSELGVKDAALFLGTLPYERLPLLHNMAEALVSIPDSDGMPLSLLEGMACGDVPIVSDLPQYEGVIRDGENALTVNRKDPEAVAGAVLRLLKDRPFRDRLSVAAVNTVVEGGDYETEMAKMEKLYQELAGHRQTI